MAAKDTMSRRVDAEKCKKEPGAWKGYAEL